MIILTPLSLVSPSGVRVPLGYPGSFEERQRCLSDGLHQFPTNTVSKSRINR
jgi:hypothetical protein